MTEEKTLKDRVKEEVLDEIKQMSPKKVKKFKVPRKGRVSKGKSKKGYVGIMQISDSGALSFDKQPIEGSTFRSKTGEYHAVTEGSFLTYKGKPFLIQPAKKIEPWNPNKAGTNPNPLAGENETLGQRYTMARMLGDAIKMKKKATGLLIIVGIIVAGLIGYNVLAGG